MATSPARIVAAHGRPSRATPSGLPRAWLRTRRAACVTLGRLLGRPGPTRRLLPGVLAAFAMVLAVLAGPHGMSQQGMSEHGMSALMLAALQDDEVVAGAEVAYRQAQLAYAEAEAEVARAEGHRQELDAEAARREVALRELDEATLARVLAYESTVRRARDLAVDAYVRGGRQNELAVLLSSAQDDEALVRGQLLAGGVDRARDAAATLHSERVRLDRQVVQVGAEVAALRRDLDLADRAVAASLTNRQQAYQALLAALHRLADAVARAAAGEAARAEASAAGDAAGEAATTRVSDIGKPADEPGVNDAQAPSQTPPTRPVTPEPPPPPPPPPPASDPKAEAWAKLRECESGGDYQAIGGGGMYRGAYQFSQATWESVGGTGDPAGAAPGEQDHRAALLYERSGSGQWPLCGRYLDEA